MKIIPILLILAHCVAMMVKKRDKTIFLPIIALIFSAFGDMAPSFISMMGYFGVAQILYIISFSLHFSKKGLTRYGWFAALLLIAAVAGFLTFRGMIAKEKPAALMTGVSVYFVALCSMAFLAICRSGRHWRIFAIGALLFVLSDGMIAVNRFAVHIPHSHVLIMITYYAAQLLLNIKCGVSQSENQMEAEGRK